MTFEGKGYLVFMLSFIPALLEGIVNSLIGMAVFKFPTEVCFAMGFALSPVAVIIVTMAMLRLDSQGYGKDKGIGPSLIASGTFDNIVSLVAFGVCETIVWQKAAGRLSLEGVVAN